MDNNQRKPANKQSHNKNPNRPFDPKGRYDRQEGGLKREAAGKDDWQRREQRPNQGGQSRQPGQGQQQPGNRPGNNQGHNDQRR